MRLVLKWYEVGLKNRWDVGAWPKNWWGVGAWPKNMRDVGAWAKNRWGVGAWPKNRWDVGAWAKNRWDVGAWPKNRWDVGAWPKNRWGVGAWPKNRWEILRCEVLKAYNMIVNVGSLFIYLEVKTNSVGFIMCPFIILRQSAELFHAAPGLCIIRPPPPVWVYNIFFHTLNRLYS